jgi:phosphatidylserine synthase
LYGCVVILSIRTGVIRARVNMAPALTALTFLALTAQHYLGHITGIFAMKGNLRLAEFTVKTGRFHPGQNKPWT